jgi:acetoin utilization deacetylase AcuC-like enzyme
MAHKLICEDTAIAALHAQKLGQKKIAIVDFDVHHGNGAQWGFYKRKDILSISIHQNRYFPADSGMVTEQGEGEGLGYK